MSLEPNIFSDLKFLHGNHDAHPSPLTHEEIVALITAAQTHWTTEPERLLPYVNYMARAGLIQQDTDDWRDLFFETVSGGAGS